MTEKNIEERIKDYMKLYEGRGSTVEIVLGTGKTRRISQEEGDRKLAIALIGLEDARKGPNAE